MLFILIVIVLKVENVSSLRSADHYFEIKLPKFEIKIITFHHQQG